MNKRIMAVACLLFTVLVGQDVYAQQAQEEKKQLRVNAEELKKATSIVQNNRILFSDPEVLQRFIRLNQTLQKKQELSLAQ